MNRVTITGRLTQDPELRSLQNGGSVCKMRLAVDGMAPGRDTGFVNVTEFGASGEASANRLSKGWLVAVEGRLEQQRWEQDGHKRHDYGIVGHVEHLAAPRNDGREREAGVQAAAEEEAAADNGPRAAGSAVAAGRGFAERQHAAGARAEAGADW
jgi:single-strand DNA-binding protein